MAKKANPSATDGDGLRQYAVNLRKAASRMEELAKHLDAGDVHLGIVGESMFSVFAFKHVGDRLADLLGEGDQFLTDEELAEGSEVGEPE